MKRWWSAAASALGMLVHGAHAVAIDRAKVDAASDPVPTYNEETHIAYSELSVEALAAVVFIALISSVPFVLVALLGGNRVTRVHMLESTLLILWLGTAIFMFTNVLMFNSSHWEGSRPLTIVEAVYLLSQILTTVGYGDITPAFPRGQVWVAVNVLIALCLYGSIIMEVSEYITEKVVKAGMELRTAVQRALTPRGRNECVETGDGHFDSRAVQWVSRPLKDWRNSATEVDYKPFFKNLASFVLFTTIGVFFWHFYPGENKTFLQAIYMSVITLSTVGFGFFNATTEAGKVFGAFWMLFGVATLAGTIASFVDLMSRIKAQERRCKVVEQISFYRLVNRHCKPGNDDKGMDAYTFMKYALQLQGIVTDEELERIEDRFKFFDRDNKGEVSLDEVHGAERPPDTFVEERDRRANQFFSLRVS